MEDWKVQLLVAGIELVGLLIVSGIIFVIVSKRDNNTKKELQQMISDDIDRKIKSEERRFTETTKDMIDSIEAQIEIHSTTSANVELQIEAQRNQSAREFIAKSRSEWLEKFRETYTDFVQLLYAMINIKLGKETEEDYIKEYNENNQKVTKLSTTFFLMLNPKGEKDKEIMLLTHDIMNDLNEIAIDMDLEEAKELMAPIILSVQKMNEKVAEYLKEEWDKVKEDINYNNR